ncbi:MAG: nucleotidyl transferase AbiEii/AbiGii toxin family protein [Anaerolineaceae bacterium]|nr:nucleotidyl transferase AbiEii/AbiGii toxin family protein [Anaerolineaceae bacterium]
MKDFLHGQVQKATSPVEARNLTREYLQARILSDLQRSGAMIPLAFHGGTALRFLYSHGRFSEDLDFALEGTKESYRFRDYLKSIQSTFTLENYQIDIKLQDKRIVHNAFIRFPGLLYELGLSNQPTEVIAIKIEVDTNPPTGAGLETTIIRKYVVLQLHHHDKASLLSGKIHAILQRPYSKGRDFYDLFWYLSDPNWPEPNLELLNNALAQTNWVGGEVTSENWRNLIKERIDQMNWTVVINDVKPFIEANFNLELLTRKNLEKILTGSREI